MVTFPERNDGSFLCSCFLYYISHCLWNHVKEPSPLAGTDPQGGKPADTGQKAAPFLFAGAKVRQLFRSAKYYGNFFSRDAHFFPREGRGAGGRRRDTYLIIYAHAHTRK